MEMHAIQSKQASISSGCNVPLVSHIEVNTLWFGTGKRARVKEWDWAKSA
jgi:hypothetical protein